METTWTDRVKTRMRQTGISQITLAKALGCTRGAVGHYLSGRRQPTLKQLKCIAETLQIDPAWMVFGNREDAVHETAQSYGSTIGQRVEIPVLGTTQTGVGKEVIGHVMFESSPSHTFAISVTGTSWAPRFHEGETIILSSDQQPQPGDEVLVHYRNGGVKIQQLVRFQGEHVILDTLTEQRCRQNCALTEIDSMYTLFAVIH